MGFNVAGLRHFNAQTIWGSLAAFTFLGPIGASLVPVPYEAIPFFSFVVAAIAPLLMIGGYFSSSMEEKAGPSLRRSFVALTIGIVTSTVLWTPLGLLLELVAKMSLGAWIHFAVWASYASWLTYVVATFRLNWKKGLIGGLFSGLVVLVCWACIISGPLARAMVGFPVDIVLEGLMGMAVIGPVFLLFRWLLALIHRHLITYNAQSGRDSSRG